MEPLSFAMVTADRPDLVAECAASYLTGRTPPAEIIVADDSRTPSNTRSRVTGRHITRADRRNYVAQLSKQGIRTHVASYALLGADDTWFTAGANRNAVLLDTLGSRVLMVDDDTRGRTAVHPHSATEIRVGGRPDPTDIHFFRTREEAMTLAHWEDVDLIAANASSLGIPLQYGGSVKSVSHGVVGDSGFFSPAHLLWMASSATTERLRTSDAVLATAMSSREVVRLAPAATLTCGAVCMATALGLDNREALPPFLPLGRNEDGVFGNLLSRCHPDAYTLHPPYGIVHTPDGAKTYSRLCGDPQTLRLSELIILLLSICRATTLPELGEHLLQFTREPLEFLPRARHTVRIARTHLLTRLERQWGNFEGFSPMWIALANRYRAALQALIDSPDCWMPLELQHLPTDAAETEAARLVSLTGELLIAWPDIVQAAGYLQTREIRLSRAVPDTSA